MTFLKNTTSRFFQLNGLNMVTAFLLVVCVLSFSGCGGGGGGSTPTTTTTTSTTTTEINYDAIPVVSTSGEGTVGTSGGKVTLEGAAVAVPENAVSGNTAISLQKITTDDVINTPPEVFVQAGNYYVVSSSASEFQKPVQVTILYDSGVATSDDDLKLTSIYMWNGNEYIAVPTEVDTTAKTLKALVDNLSEDVNVSPKRKKGLESMVTAGTYVFKKDKNKISSDCTNSGGKFNGYYCECASGMYWDNNLSQCIASDYNYSGDNSRMSIDFDSYRVLTANVGNIAATCKPYLNKLCWISTEENIANQIRKYYPDIISLQERLPRSWCNEHTNLINPWQSCALPGEQIDRLLGDGYDKYCISYPSGGGGAGKFSGNSQTNGYECMGIKKGIGITVTDYESILNSCSADTGPLKVTAQTLSGNKIIIFNAHTATPFKDIFHPLEIINVDCRVAQIEQMFQKAESYTLIMGDMNMDPFNGSGADAVLWNKYVKETPYTYHSEHGTNATPTISEIQRINGSRVFDHIISNFASGDCTTLTGSDNLSKGSGMDHNAILCWMLDFSGVSREGNISGTIRNALTGNGVPNLTVNFRRGSNIKSGTVVVTTNTDSDGQYTVHDLNEGVYTGEASGSGYVTSYFPAECIGATTNYSQDGTVTAPLPSGQTRIVLTWGENPRDIDSHLTGPCPSDDGTDVCVGERFHIFYRFAEDNEDNINSDDGILNGTSPWPDYVKLDVDDTTSYGPETTTIYQQSTGMYRFSVHDFTNRSKSYSYSLSYSGTQVKVYRGSNLVAKYNVPVGEEGTLWTVFELKGNNITAINTMSYESDSESVQKQKVFKTDADLLLNLPLKK